MNEGKMKKEVIAEILILVCIFGAAILGFGLFNHYKFEKPNTYNILFKDKDGFIKNTYKAGITKFTCIGYDLDSSKKAIDIAKEFGIYDEDDIISVYLVNKYKNQLTKFSITEVNSI